MDKDKAQELISQLEDNHTEQIQCLQALFGLASQGQANETHEEAEEVEGIHALTCPFLMILIKYIRSRRYE